MARQPEMFVRSLVPAEAHRSGQDHADGAGSGSAAPGRVVLASAAEQVPTAWVGDRRLVVMDPQGALRSGPVCRPWTGGSGCSSSIVTTARSANRCRKVHTPAFRQTSFGKAVKASTSARGVEVDGHVGEFVGQGVHDPVELGVVADLPSCLLDRLLFGAPGAALLELAEPGLDERLGLWVAVAAAAIGDAAGDSCWRRSRGVNCQPAPVTPRPPPPPARAPAGYSGSSTHAGGRAAPLATARAPLRDCTATGSRPVARLSPAPSNPGSCTRRRPLLNGPVVARPVRQPNRFFRLRHSAVDIRFCRSEVLGEPARPGLGGSSVCCLSAVCRPRGTRGRRSHGWCLACGRCSP
jgi:hypothetical protein